MGEGVNGEDRGEVDEGEGLKREDKGEVEEGLKGEDMGEEGETTLDSLMSRRDWNLSWKTENKENENMDLHPYPDYKSVLHLVETLLAAVDFADCD